jgi:glycosyltransferase involved in cell wall biosynthesis
VTPAALAAETRRPAPSSAPCLSVIVPVRNGERTIAGCVESILRGDFPDSAREVIVVDNGSTDRTARLLERYPIIRLSEPRRGPSNARNRGIEASRGNILAFIDADCVATPGWLRALTAAFADARISGVAGEILAYPPRTAAERYAAARRPRWQHAALHSERPYVVTANVAFRRSTFAALGGFDPRFITGEDQEFSRRFFQAGYALRYCAEAVVFHRHRDTAWRLFRQHFGWGWGAEQLGVYAWRSELAALLACTSRLVRAGRRRPAPAVPGDAGFELFEMLRLTARAGGALQYAASRVVRARAAGRTTRSAPERFWRADSPV